jgi:hypothetical protein
VTGFSSEEIQAARALVEAATPGEWIVANGGTLIVPDNLLGQAIGGTEHVADAEFIAEARTLVPRLLDALDEARAEITATERLADENGEMATRAAGRAQRAEAAVVEARKAALHEAADEIEAQCGHGSAVGCNESAAWLRARADAQGSTP